MTSGLTHSNRREQRLRNRLTVQATPRALAPLGPFGTRLSEERGVVQLGSLAASGRRRRFKLDRDSRLGLLV